MFQPDLQLHLLSHHPSSLSLSLSRRKEQSTIVSRSEATPSQLKETLCAEMSPNKRAIVEQLIQRWSQGNLD